MHRIGAALSLAVMSMFLIAGNDPVLLKDDLQKYADDSDGAPEWRTAKGTWSVGSGACTSVKGLDALLWRELPGSGGYSFSAKVKAVEGKMSGSGVAAGMLDGRNGYVFFISAKQTALQKMENGVRSDIVARLSETHAMDTSYELTITIRSGIASAFVDGVKKFEVKDASFTGRGAGVWSYEPGVRFSDISAINVSAGDRTMDSVQKSAGITVHNKGIGGNNTKQGLSRMESDVLALDPTHVVLYFGMNDSVNSGNAVAPQTYRENLTTMIARVREKGALPVLVTITPVIEAYLLSRHKKEFFADGSPNAKIDAYNNIVREVAAEQKAALVDLNAVFRSRGEPKEDKTSLLRNKANSAADGVHYMPEGYALFAAEVARAIGTIKKGDIIVCFGDSLTFGAGMKGEGTITGDAYPAYLSRLVNAEVSTSRAELANEHIRIALLPPAEGGSIASIRSANGVEFINAKVPPLWEIELRSIHSRPAASTVALSLDPEQDDRVASKDDAGGDTLTMRAGALKADCSSETSKGSITYHWNNMAVGAESGVLDVWVSISLAPGDAFLRSTAGIINRSKNYTVFYLTAPIVGGVYPSDKDTSRDRLATPASDGRLIHDPIHNGVLGQKRRFQPNRSGHSMQFDAYYHNGEGLYLGCFDGAENAKRYVLAADEGGISWAVVHVPNNMKKVPQEWSTPYETVIRCFSGDWYDAARIYRTWALTQTWTAEGPLATRTIPKWFKDIDEWLLWGVNKDQSQIYGDKMKALVSGMNTGLITYNWSRTHELEKETPDVFPIDAATETYMAKAKAAHYPLMGYLQGICWDTNAASFQEDNGMDHTVRNLYDQRVVWPLGKLTPAIAYPGETWTKRLKAAVEKMAAAGFKSIYLDSGNHGGTYLNFNPLESTDSGGGTGYIHGQRKLIRELKNAARSIDPDVCFTAESFWEGNMAELDAYMSCNTTFQYLHKDHAFPIPLAHAVYHDRTILYSAWVNRQDVEQKDAMGYVAKFGQIFVWGVKAGWNIPNLFLTYKNSDIAYESSRRRYEAYAASKQFLLYGDMLREPALGGTPAVDVKWYRGWSDQCYDIEMPAVLASAWRSPEGELGIALYNISPAAQNVSFTLSESDHGIVKGKNYSLSGGCMKYGSAGATSSKDGIVVTCRIDARSPFTASVR